MPRQIIAVEGRQVFPDQLLEVGCCEWFEDEVYVFKDGNIPEVIGRATDLQNEPDETITAEIDWMRPEDQSFSTTVFLDEVSKTVYDNGLIIVHSGIIKRIFLGTVPWGETGKLL